MRFGRFKLGANETVPAIPYTANEERDINRFVIKGLLSESGVGAEPEAPVEAAELPSTSEVVVEAPVGAEPVAPVEAAELPSTSEEVVEAPVGATEAEDEDSTSKQRKGSRKAK